MSKQRKQRSAKKERITVRTLLLANVAAVIALVLTTLAVLWATGLLSSMLPF